MPVTQKGLPAGLLNDPDLLRRVNRLRQTDNLTNWFYLGREYLFLGSAVGIALAFFHFRADLGLSWVLNLPVTLLAIFLVGVGQHRLITLGHEASHYMLFRNRWLNELASDWLCMFPVWSITHNYRLQHLAHHQFVNDPQRDPDFHFMQASGHEYRFPMAGRHFLWQCVIKTLVWLPGLVGYIRIRARNSAIGGGTGPYQAKGKRPKLLVIVGVLYLGSLALVLTALCHWADPWRLGGVPLVLLASVLTFYAVVPERFYPRTSVKPIVSPRLWTLMRLTYLSLLFNALAWLSYVTGHPWGLYYILLWLVPLGTTFPYFMILRELMQHGDAGMDRFTHTRIFGGSGIIAFMVFPLGMDCHLPHHLFPMVPHYRLKALHNLLSGAEIYNQQITVVERDFSPLVAPGRGPSDRHQGGSILERVNPAGS